MSFQTLEQIVLNKHPKARIISPTPASFMLDFMVEKYKKLDSSLKTPEPTMIVVIEHPSSNTLPASLRYQTLLVDMEQKMIVAETG